MHKKFDINRIKIKGGCWSGRKVVTHNAKSDLPLLLAMFAATTKTTAVGGHMKARDFSETLCTVWRKNSILIKKTEKSL